MQYICSILWYVVTYSPSIFGISRVLTTVCTNFATEYGASFFVCTSDSVIGCQSKAHACNFILQVPLLPLSSPVLTSLRISVELWMLLWAGLWVVETMLISTSSTLSLMLPRPHMGDFWTSPLPVLHNMNWLVSWQAMSTTSQYVVSTVEVW